MISIEFKNSVFEALGGKLAEGVSAADLARKAGINEGYMSSVRNRKWDNHSNGSPVPDTVWIKLGRLLQVGSVTVALPNHQIAIAAFEEARRHSQARILDGGTGTGKSHAAKAYALKHPKDVFLVRCASDFSEKGFMIEMAAVVMRQTGNQLQLRDNTKETLRRDISITLSKVANPLLIIDEAENLKDASYGAIKTLYDDLEGTCGIVLIGANNYLATLRSKAAKNKGNHCFPQILSRFCYNAVEMKPITPSDIRASAVAYGVADDKEVMAELLSGSDLRYVFGALRREQQMAIEL